LKSEVDEKVKSGPLVLVSDFPASESSEPFERALNDAINLQLVKNKAKELDIEVDDADVEAQIDKLLSSQNLTREGLTEFLRSQGKSYKDYKKDFHDQLLFRRFQGRAIAPAIKVTEKDVQAYFLKKSGSNPDMLQVSLRQLLVAIPGGSSEEFIKAKESLASEVYEKLKGGMDFVEAVKIYSDAPNARVDGGLLQGVSLKDLNDSIRKPLANLEEGQFSEPIRSPMGIHVFLLEAKKFLESPQFVNQKRELEYELRMQELNVEIARWLELERQRSKVEVLSN
jgi:parvulin-like peptidyl-prolyl isomerase